MAIFTNVTGDTLSFGTGFLVPEATIDETEQDVIALRNIKYFYEKDYLELTSGTPDFTRAIVSDVGVLQHTDVEWGALDPVVPINVFCVSTTTGALKIGDGDTLWSNLPIIGTDT